MRIRKCSAMPECSLKHKKKEGKKNTIVTGIIQIGKPELNWPSLYKIFESGWTPKGKMFSERRPKRAKRLLLLWSSPLVIDDFVGLKPLSVMAWLSVMILVGVSGFEDHQWIIIYRLERTVSKSSGKKAKAISWIYNPGPYTGEIISYSFLQISRAHSLPSLTEEIRVTLHQNWEVLYFYYLKWVTKHPSVI